MDEPVLEDWMPLAGAIAREFFIPGAEDEDVRQEAYVALWIALRDYNPSIGAFAPFASLVIRRQLTDCIKTANRYKHLTLTRALRGMVNDEGEYEDAAEVIPAPREVADIAEANERFARFIEVVGTELTPREHECLMGVASGLRYDQLGAPKTVDNSVQRGRRKLHVAMVDW